MPKPADQILDRSPEIEAVVTRWLHAIAAKDTATLVNLLSTSEHLTYVGTDADEIWGGSMLRSGFPEHISEIPPFTIDTHRVEGYAAGSVGWAFWIGRLQFEGIEEPRRMRHSWVLMLEQGIWRIVDTHVSTPRPNIETMGRDHFAFDALIEAARSEAAPLPGEGTATIMFTDIVNSTGMAATVGDTLWTLVIRKHHDLLGGVIGAEGGQLIKTLGDGSMSSFTSVRAALAAARGIQAAVSSSTDEPVLSVRIGLHTGDVIQAEGDFFGTAVNKAARIAAVAEPAQILVSSATRAMVDADNRFRFLSEENVSLRGLDGPQSVSSLVWRE